MSKKSKKKKLKKKLRALLRAQMAQSEQKQEIEHLPAGEAGGEIRLGRIKQVPTKKIEKPTFQKPEETKKEEAFEKQAPTLETKKDNFTQKLNPYFSYDIKKVLITIGICIIIIAGISLIAHYTDWITLLSQKISSLINL